MKNKSFFVLIIANCAIACCLLPVACSYAQNPKWMVFDTSNSGLPDNKVFEITIDSSGTKWIGVGLVNEGGDNSVDLVKFDNHIWNHFDMNQDPMLD